MEFGCTEFPLHVSLKMKQVNIKTVCETVLNETIVEDEAYAEANAVHRPWFKHSLNMWYIFNIVHSSSEYAYVSSTISIWIIFSV